MHEQLKNSDLAQVRERKKPPRFLRMACVLSMVNGVAHTFITLMNALSGPISTTDLKEQNQETVSFFKGSSYEFIGNAQIEFNRLLNEHNTKVSLTFAILYLMSVMGVYQMYNLRKKGFPMYLVAQALIILTPLYLVVVNDYTVTTAIIGTILTFMFSVVYALNLKRMH